MFCRNCGKEFDGKFCPECGAAAQNDVEYIQPSQEPVQFSGPDIMDKPKAKKKKPKGCLIAVLVVLAFMIIAGIIGSNGETSTSSSTPQSTASSLAIGSNGQTASSRPVVSAAPESQVSQTMGEKNAKSKAMDYLAYKGFSYSGLIEQLEFEGFTNEEAVYAADNCGADWNEQAARSAKDYLDYSSFSKQGLIEQLEFEGYTNEQATYGAEANGY